MKTKPRMRRLWASPHGEMWRCTRVSSNGCSIHVGDAPTPKQAYEYCVYGRLTKHTGNAAKRPDDGKTKSPH